MAEKVSIRNLGILAHVDAGKTTLTEHIIFLSGATRAVGRVDKGTSLSDGLSVERRRGISVRASTISLKWSDIQINLIDTPGHMDFAAEVERSLRVLDCAALVLSAVEGIQSHTEIIWEALAQLGIPVILYVNKIDRIGSDTDTLIADIRKVFSPNIVLMNRPIREGTDDAGIEDLFHEDSQDVVEAIVGSDDAALAGYLDGQIPDFKTLRSVLKDGVGDRRLFPVLFGSAKNQIGTQTLLNTVRDFCPEVPSRTDLPVSGVIYKVESDPKLGRIAGVRLYAGRLKNRDSVFNISGDREEKITQIKKSVLNQYVDTPVLNAGDIGFLCGLPEAQIGDILGDAGPVPGAYKLTEPVLSAQVTAQDPEQYAALAEALTVLSSEDPHLNFSWLNKEREIHVKIMGKIQMEILTEILDTRFGLKARFGEPTVIYKETLLETAYCEESYTMPKPCWAIVKFEMRSAPRGSGVAFRSRLSVDRVKQKYQNEMAANVLGSLKQGTKGWEVTDIELDLVDGGDHVLHSRPGNFKMAMNMAVMKGLTEAGTHLLEPILAFHIAAPETHVGKISSDIIEMRGRFEPAQVSQGICKIKGKLPLATAMEYPMRLSSLTGGRAKISLRFHGYELCPEGQGVIRPYKGISPLDRSKYILKERGAITER